MQERRQHVRVKSPALIEFRDPATSQTERSFTHDISETGLRFPTTVKFQVGEELALSLELPFRDSQGVPFRATGEVIWIREVARLGATQYDVGLRFRWIEDPDRQRLLHHLKACLTAGV
jgi:Tfp pilus assembly protein PilZ